MMFGEVYTCSKHNYSGVGNPCPDCAKESLSPSSSVQSGIKTIIKDMKEQIADSDRLGYDHKEKDWGYEKGILLTPKQAQILINVLERSVKK